MSVTTAILRLDVEGGSAVTSEVRKAVGDLKGAQKDIEKASVDAVARIEAAQKAASERAKGRRRRDAVETVQETAQAVARQGGVYRQGAAVAVRTEQLVTRAKLRELARQGEEQRKFSERYAAALKAATAALEAEVGKRGQLSERERRQVESVALAMVASHERAERQRTAATVSEDRKRREVWGRRMERAGAAAGAAAGGVGQVGAVAHAAYQGARGSAAAQETELNSIAIQTGADAGEAAQMRAAVRAYIRAHHMDADSVIGALSGAQSRFNALGADTAEGRRAALTQTLDDVRFAANVDPNNVGAIPAFSAMLRQQGVGGETRSAILRAATGISFAGSVETDDALRSGLPGMLRSLSTTLAATPAGQRDQVTQTAVADFLAQIQTVAATGGSVGVSANRMNTLRTFLSNPYRQDQLGQALARRTMTPEQRAEFAQTFHRGRDGKYTMDAAAVNSPSRAASVMGHLFNNDATALASFLGAHGGGGNRQLMNRPEVALLSSYFAMGQDAQGRTVRQYDAVNSLAQQTVTPQRMAQIEEIRRGEDRNNLNDDTNNQRAALTDNTGQLKRLSDQLAAFQERNPIVTGAAPVVATVVAGVLGAKGAAVVGGALAMDAQARALATGKTFDGRQIGAVERVGRGAASVLGGPIAAAVLTARDAYNAAQTPRGLDALLDALPGRIADALRANPPTAVVSAGDAAHAATTSAGNGGR